MKRERVTSTESNQNDEVLRYNIHRQYEGLKRQISIVNETFSTNYEIILNVDTVRDEQRGEENERTEENRPDKQVESSEPDDNRADNE